MDNINILMLTVRADHGGGPQHVDLLINDLSNKFNIFIGVPKDKPYYNKWKSNKKVTNVFELPHRKFTFIKLLELNKFVQQNNITIIHSHGKGAGIYSRLLKIINPKLKIIHTLHGFHIQEYNFIKKQIYILIEKFLSLFTNKFINVSNGEQKICLDFNIYKKENSTIIYNAINNVISIKKAKENINLKNKIIISSITRFDYAKNMLFTYEIAKEFKNSKNIVFLWVGDGEDKILLEKKAKEENLNIIFTGFTTDIPLYLSATDIYLSTSRWEGLPYALIEAQSLGIPIIATDVVGNNEVVTNSKNGFLFSNAKQAVEDINLLIKNNDLYNKFSDDAKKNFDKNFNMEIMIQKVENIYEDFR